jgi:hypothetical protein
MASTLTGGGGGVATGGAATGGAGQALSAEMRQFLWKIKWLKLRIHVNLETAAGHPWGLGVAVLRAYHAAQKNWA